MSQEQQLKDTLESVLSEAKKLGATSAEASVSQGKGLSVEVRMGEVDTLEYHRDQGLSITVYFDHRKGSASTGDLSRGAVKDTLEAACRIAKYTSEDPCAGLADKDRMATEFRDLDLYHPWEISAEEAIAKAKECEAAARDVSVLITNSNGASVGSFEAGKLYANTHGFMGFSQGTRHMLSCSMVAEEKGAMQRDYWQSSARVHDDLDTAEAVGQRAADRALKRLHGRQIETTKVPVLYEPSLARGFMSHFTSGISGSALYRKASFLLDSLDQQIFPEFLNAYERPFIQQGMASTNFDKEGVAVSEKDFIRNGVVQSYLLGSYSARQLGMQSTGNAGGTHNLIVESTGESFEQLLKKMGTGMLVTELIGSSVNMMTGDYSRGASGYWVEEGEIQYPVEEVTVAGNLKDMFKNIVAIGNDVETQFSTRTGSILIGEVTIAGK